ncbi:MAG: cellulase family glycosylhydrolase [Prevotella sp.]|nr:cellulase family glycosylhydrolase [Prevotella sp.]
MITRNIRTFLMAAMMCCGITTALTACSDSDDSSATRLTVMKDGAAVSQLNFTLASSSQLLAINTDGEWTAETSDTTWCRLQVHAGYGYADSLRNSYTRVTVAKNEGEAREAVITIKAGDMTQTVTVSQRGMGTDAGDTFMSGFQLVENLVLGYNLGNTLDASHDPATQSWFKPTTVSDWETCWGQPVTTPEIIQDITERGFNIIRVPVTWFPHMDSEGNVDEAWMNRVEEVVNYVLDAGCYCILNVQHDTGATDGTRTDSIAWIAADIDEYPAISPRFKHLWTQIATRFRDYDDHLLFEAMNETLNGQRQWNTANSASDYEALNKLLQDFVDAVRATGGNNEFRNLVINPMGAASKQEDIDAFECPYDTHANHLIASVHSYDPYNFCNDGGEWNHYIFDTECTDEIDAIFARVEKRFAQELGMPFFFGEFGAIDRKKDMAERIKYAKYMVSKFKAYGTSGLWWMGLYDREEMEWDEEEIANALFESLQ